MRILRVITRLDVHGGAELSTLIEVEELSARGHEVMVVTLSEPTTEAAAVRLAEADIETLHLGGAGVGQVLGVRRLLRRWRPDVVHAVIFRPEIVVAAAAVGTGVATIVSLVNMQYGPDAVARAPSPRRLEGLRRIESLVLRRGFDRFHSLTVAGEDHSVDRLGIDRSRSVVIPRGRRRSDVEADPERCEELRAGLAAPDRPLLVNVGRHEVQKGQDLFIDVVADLVGSGVAVSAVVAGREGRGTPALQERADRAGLGGDLALLGARRDVRELLGAADVVCVTSRWEGLGGSIIEALGAGAPIVAFGVPAVREVVGGAGVVVDAFDTSAYAEAVRALLDDDLRRDELSQAARDRFSSEFEIGPVVDRIEAMYVEASATSPGGAR